jgi:tetratricopeptide (TPR) repeat protein
MEERKILDSWKEISAYLNRSVMTCHRWEEELGLPIHRLDGTPKARVFAYTDELDRWLAEKLRVAEAPRQERRKRTKWIWITAGTVLAVAMLAAIGWQLFSQASIPAPAQVPSLAVLPFENRTGDGTWDAWKMALPDLITIDLRQSKFMDVIKTSNLFRAVGALAEAEKFSPEDLKKVAEKAEVGYALTGGFNKSGEDIIINALLQNARTGEVMAIPRSRCRTENDIFLSVDDLSKEVKIALNLKPREIRFDIDKPVVRITTSSPEAFKLFSQGYRIQGKHKFDEAISPLLKAVELDPKFGLAYRALFLVCRNTSRSEETKKYGKMAIRLADRIEERERGFFLADFYLHEQLDKKKAIQVFQRLRKGYPYDPTMTGLAEFYSDQEEWDKALPILEKLISRYKQRPDFINNLSICYKDMGLYDKAEKLLDDYLSTNPDPGTDMIPILLERWSLALAQNKFDEAHNCIDRLISAFPNLPAYLAHKGYVYFKQDDLTNAEKEYQKLVEKEDKRTQMGGFRQLAQVSLSRGKIEEAKQRILQAIELAKSLKDGNSESHWHYFLAYLHRISGQLPEALKEAEQACRDSEMEGVGLVRELNLRALITLEMNRFEEFEKQVEEIKTFLDPDRFPRGSPRLMRVYYHLLGHRELQKNNLDLAIRYFWKALDLLSVLHAGSFDADHTKYFYDLAEAYRRSGNFSGAFSMYKKVVLPTVSREFSGDLYAKSYYRMGLEWERTMGNMGTPADTRERRLKAIECYRKFLDLWKDADPIFPEVVDAKKRLAHLEAELEIQSRPIVPSGPGLGASYLPSFRPASILTKKAPSFGVSWYPMMR